MTTKVMQPLISTNPLPSLSAFENHYFYFHMSAAFFEECALTSMTSHKQICINTK